MRNERRKIVECLAALPAAAGGHPLIAHVMANGCTDGTEEAVRAWAADRDDVRLISLPLGDKASAWNEYVHTIRSGADVHFFVDGHVRPGPRSMAILAEALAPIDGADPARGAANAAGTGAAGAGANAAGALPSSGRHRDAWRSRMLLHRTLAGGLYALPRRFIDRIRARGVKLPAGFLGDDTLVSYLARGNLGEGPKRDPAGDPSADDPRLILDERAGFTFTPLSPLHPRDWRTYMRRRFRQALKAYQYTLLMPRLEKGGLEAMPASVDELYAAADPLPHLCWRASDSIFYSLARRHIRRRVARRS